MGMAAARSCAAWNYAPRSPRDPAGLRIATVSTIALATVAAFVIPEGLGYPIFLALRILQDGLIVAFGAGRGLR